jgi:hypothetical protein
VEFSRAIHVLCDGGIEFVVIGGLSAYFHGSTRLTFDLDICYCRTSANLRRLAAALAPYHPRPRGFPAGLPFVWDETTLRNGGLFTLTTDLGDIDLLAEVSGVGAYEDALARSIRVKAFDRELATLDLPSLLDSKRAAGRLKDQLDIAELETVRETSRTERSSNEPD